MLLRPATPTRPWKRGKIAVAHTEGPVGLVLTRQKLPTLDRIRWPPLRERQKELMSLPTAQQVPRKFILIATGSEVSIALRRTTNSLMRELQPGGLDAVLGFVSGAAAILQGHGPSSRRQSASQC